jgi:predicted kinase
MHLTAEYLLQAGQNVVVSATYNRDQHRRGAAVLANSVALVQCRAPLETVIDRFKSRPAGHAALDLTEDLVRDLWMNFAWSRDGIVAGTSDEAVAHIRGSTGDSLERWKRMQ